MKKIIIVICLFLSINCKSQTLTAQACNPVFAESWILAAGNFTQAGSSGANQIWNFSNISFTPSMQTRVGSNPLDLPANFSVAPNANFAWAVNNVGIYFLQDQYGIEKLGEGQESSSVIYNDFKTILKYPFSLGSTFNDNYNCTYAPNSQNQSVWVASTTVTADGTGTLILPSGSFPNTLRIRHVENYTVTTSSYSYAAIAEEYKWYVPGVHTELLAIYSQTNLANPNNPGLQYLSFRENFNLLSDSRSEGGFNDKLTVLFNSSLKELIIKSSVETKTKLEITGLDGRSVFFNEFATEEGHFDLANVPSGIYLVNVKQGLNQAFKKIIIN